MPPTHSANSWSADSQMANVHSLTAKGVNVSIEEQSLYNFFGGVDISPPLISKKWIPIILMVMLKTPQKKGQFL